MKKRHCYLLILFFTFTIFNYHCQFEYIDNENIENLECLLENLNNLNLKGKIKSIYETSYLGELKNGQYEKTIKGWRFDFDKDNEMKFDDFGNLIEKKEYKNSIATSNYQYKYDSKNRIIEINQLYFNYFYFYDSLNRIKTSKQIDKQPNSISQGKTQPINGTTSFVKYFYNNQGKLSKRITTDKNKKILNTEIYSYDNSNNLILKEIKHNNFDETYELSYNDENKVVKILWKDSEDGINEYTEYQYEGGKLSLEHWVDYEEGEPDGYIDYKFKDGNPSDVVVVEKDGTISSKEKYIYDFDLNGNWIKQIILDDTKIYIVERKITY